MVKGWFRVRLKNYSVLKSLKITIFSLYRLIPSSFYFFKTSIFNSKDFFLYSYIEKVFFLVNFLKYSLFFRVSMLNDISVIDFLKAKSRFKVIYNLSTLNFNTRFFISFFVTGGGFILSLDSLFKSSQ
jgi:NADH:ubiquinone oxidoreductase subunit C